MQNYWIERDVNKRDGWEYISPDFRIKHEDGSGFGSDEVQPYIVMQEQNPKCPMCGRIKVVSKKEDHLFYCSHCAMLFDDRDDD